MRRLAPALLLALAAFATPTLALQPDSRPVVKTADELPRHEYAIEGKASEFLLSDKPLKDLAAKMAADAKDDLQKFNIADPTTLQGYYNLLGAIAMLDSKFDESVVWFRKSRELEAKESKKLMTGIVAEAIATAKRASSEDPSKFEAAFKDDLHARVSAMPWDVVREEVLQAKGRAELLKRDLVIGSIQGQLDPVVEQQKGVLSRDLARGLITARMVLDVRLPLMPIEASVYASLVEKHTTAKVDIWAARSVELKGDDKASPVVLAIWDSGTDFPIFKDQLWTNPKETPNGKDDDANGFIDDLHGIAFDLVDNRVPEPLHPLTDMRSDLRVVTQHTKGMMDMQASIDSPEASALRQHIGALKPAEVTGFIEDLGLFGMFAHGTHVAGIAAEGNPFARLLAVRIAFDFRQIPLHAPSVEQQEKNAKAIADAVAYMKQAGVRVANMSWGGSRKDVERELEVKGVGESPAERADLARKIFKIQKDALEAAMKSAPEILFIAAAGNSDNDVDFDEMIPSGIKLPNLITVGAVDQSGKPTGFTSFGKGVSLYANGFEVDSYIPGGQRMKFSGTSMAAPNVANLAGKLLALKPTLTTSELLQVIQSTADPMPNFSDRFLINPKAAVARVREGAK